MMPAQAVSWLIEIVLPSAMSTESRTPLCKHGVTASSPVGSTLVAPLSCLTIESGAAAQLLRNSPSAWLKAGSASGSLVWQRTQQTSV
jgi:hypothetical protein